ncbi:MAG: imidazolonepropionase [Chitinophagia bacterium]|nr:imidazolonepropionase [Chitinophagia bacterium]
MITLIEHIGGLYLNEQYTGPVRGEAMSTLPVLRNAWLAIEQGRIHSFGSMDTPFTTRHTVAYRDAKGGLVLPAWCDSHTHLVFAAGREKEFVSRIKGLSYEEIARQGGGILNSAQKLNETPEEQLYDSALHRLYQLARSGTGAIEIKSGYSLYPDGELKMLRVIRKLKETTPFIIKATLLAGHAYPLEYRNNKAAYIQLMINNAIPRAAGEGLADYIDVFCEEGFFSISDTEQLLEAGWKYGLKPKIHANQLHYSGGVQTGVRMNAVSVDHLECVGEEEIDCLRNSNTIPTLLPGAAFFLGMHYQPARKMIDAGLGLCLASDYNPGSCPSGNIPLLLTIACTQLKMTPEEAINAVTVNGAAAMEILDTAGSIAPGKVANLIITHPMADVATIPYDYGNNPVEAVMIGGGFL